MSELLVSVRNAAEAEEAIAGGAAIVDIKEPNNGPLGRPRRQVIEQVVETVHARCPVSLAFGEVGEGWKPHDWPSLSKLPLNFIKVGLSFASAIGDWRKVLNLWRYYATDIDEAELVPVAYADWERAEAPSPYDVMSFAIKRRFAAFLIDTWTKDGSTLLDWMSAKELAECCTKCRDAGVRIAFAGSLKREQIAELLAAAPDWFAVRGAACVGGRQGTVSRQRVAELVSLLSVPC